MFSTHRSWLWIAVWILTIGVTHAQTGKLDGAYLCGINGQCVYTPLIAQRYELVITTECGAWHDQLKADNPNVMTFIYTSGTDNYTNPYPVDEGWYYAGREHAWLVQRCRELGYSPEILYMHYYENTEVSGFTIPGTYSTTLTDADSVSRVPVYLGYYSGNGVGRMLVNFSHPITRRLQIEYAKKAWTDPNAGEDWPQTSHWDGYYLDNWVADELDPGMGQIGSVTSGGRLVEHPTHAVIYSSESIDWYQQQQNQFARELRDVLHNGAAWSPDGKPKYLCANIANTWIADFADPEICGLDYLNQEFQYSPLRSPRYDIMAAYSRDSACYVNGSHTIYVSLQAEQPSSGSGSVTQAEALYDNLAWYYTTRGPNTYMYQYHQEPSTYYIDPGVTGWDTLTWRGCMDFEVGASLGRYAVLQSGTDPIGQSYVVFKREYANALVLMRARGDWSEDITPQTAVTVTLPTAYREVRVDGSLGSLSTTFVLRNGRGLILAKPEGDQSLIVPPRPVSPAYNAEVELAQPTLIAGDAVDPETRALAYQFQLDQNGDFIGVDAVSSFPGEIVDAGGGSKAWMVTRPLANGLSYFWRCRAMTVSGTADTSEWSAVYRFTVILPVGNECPTPPTAVSPDNGFEIYGNFPTLEVANASDPDGDPLVYGFRIATDAGMTTIVASTEGVAASTGTTSWTAGSPLPGGQVYYWQSHAFDRQCFSGWSIARSFSVSAVNLAPPVPAGISPLGNDTISAMEVQLTAQNVIDPNGDALSYQFLLATAAGEIIQIVDNIPVGSNESTTWHPSVSVPINERYTWRVQSHDATQYSGWSELYSFFVQNLVPPVPVQLSPLDGDTVFSLNVMLNVNNAADAEGETVVYDFEVYADAGLTNLITSVENLAAGPGSTSWLADFTPFNGGHYWWRVRAKDPHQAGSWSVPEPFIVVWQIAGMAPSADFAGSPTSGCAPLTIDFIDWSQFAEAWVWDFGDGAKSGEHNPQHTYLNTGTYTVTLTAMNLYGMDSKTKTGYITVVEPRFCDLNLDGYINPIDIVLIVNYVYKNLDARLQLPGCTGDNGDWNCDGLVNPSDVVAYTGYIYRRWNTEPCNPCAP